MSNFIYAKQEMVEQEINQSSEWVEIIPRFLELCSENEIPEMFLQSRKYDKEILKKLGVGYCSSDIQEQLKREFDPEEVEKLELWKYNSRVIIPYNSTYFSARKVYENTNGTKNLFPKKTLAGNKKPLFWNGKHYLVIVEGETDSIAVRHIFENDTPSILAVGGVTSAKKFIENIDVTSYKKIILCFDNDPAGEEAHNKTLKLLSKKGAQEVHRIKFKESRFKDIDDIWNEYEEKSIEHISIEKCELEKEIEEVNNKSRVDFEDVINPILEVIETEKDYQKYVDGLALKGDNILLRRAFYNYLHSVKMPILSFSIKNWSTDNRDHVFIRGIPGSGKGHCKGSAKHIAKWDEGDGFTNRVDYAEAHSVSHKDQLIGKMLPGIKTKQNKNPELIEKRGYFGKTMLISDECDKITNEEKDEYAEIQRLKRMAMDTYEYNEVSRDLVDDKPGKNIRYFSPSRFLDFAHPVKLKSIFFSSGTFRRYSSIVNLQDGDNVDLDDIFSMTDNSTSKTYYLEKSKYIKDFFLSDEHLRLILAINKAYIYALSTHENETVKLMGSMLRYASTGQFLKRVLISHSIASLPVSETSIVVKACLEHIAFNLNSIQIGINEGQLEATTTAWLGLSDEHATCLQFLLNNKHLDFESGIKIKDFKEVVGKVFGLGFRQSEKPYNYLKKEGYISTKNGQGGKSSVWLNVIPKEKQIVINNYMEILETIFSGMQSKSDDLQSSIDSFLDENPHLKTQKCKKCNNRPLSNKNNSTIRDVPLNFIHYIIYLFKGGVESNISNIPDKKQGSEDIILDDKETISGMQNDPKHIAFLGNLLVTLTEKGDLLQANKDYVMLKRESIPKEYIEYIDNPVSVGTGYYSLSREKYVKYMSKVNN